MTSAISGAPSLFTLASSAITTVKDSSLGEMDVSTDLPLYAGSSNGSIGHSNVTDPMDTFHNMSAMDFVYSRWRTQPGTASAVVPIVFGLIFLVGLVGNGTLIVSVVANKVMRNVPNILIVSLSMGDFLLILVSVPMTATLYTFWNWPYGTVACKLNEFLQTLSLGVSVFTLMALSADRYVAIVDPMAKLTGRTTRATIFIAAGIWLVAIMLAIPDLFFSTLKIHDVVHNNESIRLTICYNYPFELQQSFPKISALIRLLVFFILPILTITIFYIKMAKVLMKSSENLPMETKSAAANHCRQIAARKRVAFVVLSFVIIFIVCWLPRHIFLMWYHYNDDDFNEFWHAFKITGFCLKFINSCINPFACYFLSGQFRKYYNRYLFCCCRRSRYTTLENRATLHTLNSTTRRSSPTNVSALQSQSTF